ncbi:SAF domain-containing protein [Luteimicrobium subarcticum]|uniref:Flagellar basal body P-ring formation chaperone FlgA n=1 Tax=Luteimicrobium subarcticum TaxID=620910 RepID=A0A2M8WWB9_9MICO|nr:SAF domain-containing protein [Luteimicrobium subarcticum]PJI95215.1 flagellar basal body P-ring formation chaperone FlgA [Luteimicrobium subarcticum]
MTSLHDPLPAPVAARLRRPSWRDPRLLVGLVLVAGSVAAGAAVVSAARTTTPAYVAAHDLVPGDVVAQADLRVLDVNLGSAGDRYLRPAAAPAEGQVVVAVVRQGELVPREALGAAGDVDLRAVPVPVDGALSDRVRVGATVDLWFVPDGTRSAVGGTEDSADSDSDSDSGSGTAASSDRPRRVAKDALVQQVDDGGGIVVGGTTTVQVLVPQGALPAVLAALQADGDVTLVPATS